MQHRRPRVTAQLLLLRPLAVRARVAQLRAVRVRVDRAQVARVVLCVHRKTAPRHLLRPPKVMVRLRPHRRQLPLMARHLRLPLMVRPLRLPLMVRPLRLPLMVRLRLHRRQLPRVPELNLLQPRTVFSVRGWFRVWVVM
ncbi:hypothetical protein CH294_10635 [Rhodococcus sp. 14-2483-1-1]|nr:hypothetical protein CH294_10635 [Rhodococcus sp. 14-2483-1-1]